MKRLFNTLVNLALVCVSFYSVFFLARMADRAFGAVFLPKAVPQNMGLLFLPGSEEHFDMHDYQTVERVNSLGFRDREFNIEKQAAIRIVAIGDSFTYGWGVNIEDSWPKQLEQLLRAQGLDVEILNLGKPAAGPDEYAHIAETALPLLKPDLVIMGVLAGDDLQQGPDLLSVKRMARTHFPAITRWYQLRQRAQVPTFVPMANDATHARNAYISTGKQLLEEMDAEQRAEFDKLEPYVKEVFFEGRLNPWMINHSTSSPDYFMNTLDLPGLASNIEDMADAFERVRNVADKTGAGLLALSIPEGFYVNDEAYRNVQRIGFHVVPEMHATTTPDDAVGAACTMADIPLVTVTGEFRRRADVPGLYLELDRHMTPKGNALLATFALPAARKAVEALLEARHAPTPP
jgi:lysophospholipase L1-like esterase